MNRFLSLRFVVRFLVFVSCGVFSGIAVASQLDDDVSVIDGYLRRVELDGVVVISRVKPENENGYRKVRLELKNANIILTKIQKDKLIKLSNISHSFLRHRNDVACEELDKIGMAASRLNIGYDAVLLLRNYSIAHADENILTGLLDERIILRGDGESYEVFLEDVLLPTLLNFPSIDQYMSDNQVSEYADMIVILIDNASNPMEYNEGSICIGSDNGCLEPGKLFDLLSKHSNRLSLKTHALYISMLLVKKGVFTMEQFNAIKKQSIDSDKVQELRSRLK